jgi:hypothetical protein
MRKIQSGLRERFAAHGHCWRCCHRKRRRPFVGTGDNAAHSRAPRRSSSACVWIVMSLLRTVRQAPAGRRAPTKHSERTRKRAGWSRAQAALVEDAPRLRVMGVERPLAERWCILETSSRLSSPTQPSSLRRQQTSLCNRRPRSKMVAMAAVHIELDQDVVAARGASSPAEGGGPRTDRAGTLSRGRAVQRQGSRTAGPVA